MQNVDDRAGVILNHQRRKWFATEMSNNRLMYTKDKELLLFTGTWNVNGRSPDPTVDISPWLFPKSLHSSHPADVYMLGFQEVQPLTGVDAVRADPARGKAWRNLIASSLNSEYDLVAERQLVGIFVCVFIRKNHMPYISDVNVSYAATGFLNAVGNKGGVSARFVLYNRTISCVACHLAAHTANVERRNQDFTDVVRKAVFLPPEPSNDQTSAGELRAVSSSNDMQQPSLVKYSKSAVDSSLLTNTSMSNGLPATAAGSSSWLGSFASVAATFYEISSGADTSIPNDPNAIKVLDHDVVFWLGDLNYRIDAPMDKVLDCIQSHDWDSLQNYDQLKKQMRTCNIFRGFHEGKIRFPPTYKFDRYADEYARDENGAIKRVPAYTDRILWRIGVDEDDPNGVPDLKNEEYSSAPSVYSSDHRPVYALFRMTFGVEDFLRKQKVEDKINKELDVRQARYKPSLEFSAPFVEFGDVFFEQQSEQSISIRNIGKVPTIFSVKTTQKLPPWLNFDTSHWQNVEISPGETIFLRMYILVSGKDGIAQDLCNEGCNLEAEITVLANPGNVNEPIYIRGRYVPTTLGMSLEALSMLTEPVLSLRKSRSRLHDVHGSRNYEDDQTSAPGAVPMAIPKEIWLLVDALICVQDGDDEPYMNQFPYLFLGGTDEAHVERVLAFVDRGERLPQDLGGDAIASCLLRVFEKLRNPVIPEFAYKRFIEAGYTEDGGMIRAVLDLLPPLNSNVFWYIVGLLCEIPSVQRREDRGKAIACALGMAMMRSPEGITAREEKGILSFMMTAIRSQLRTSPHEYVAVIDLTFPETHPKRLRKDNVYN